MINLENGIKTLSLSVLILHVSKKGKVAGVSFPLLLVNLSCESHRVNSQHRRPVLRFATIDYRAVPRNISR
jgi:hypothetical protein